MIGVLYFKTLQVSLMNGSCHNTVIAIGKCPPELFYDRLIKQFISTYLLKI